MAEDKDLNAQGGGDAENKQQQPEAAVVENKDKPAMNGDGENKMENGEGDKASPEPPKEMRAVVLHSFGGLKHVKSGKKPEPTGLAENEVLIKVKSW